MVNFCPTFIPKCATNTYFFHTGLGIPLWRSLNTSRAREMIYLTVLIWISVIDVVGNHINERPTATREQEQHTKALLR
jgi:hypothetical protein